MAPSQQEPLRATQTWLSPLLLAVALSPAVLQTQDLSCDSGNTTLATMTIAVGGEDQIAFESGRRDYRVWLTPDVDTVTVQVASVDPGAQVWVDVYTDSDRVTVVASATGGGEGVISLSPGTSTLRVYVKPPGGASGFYEAAISVGSVFPCTEQGVLAAVAKSDGVHRFACDAPTTILTGDELIIENAAALDGEGKLTLDGGGLHRLFWIEEEATLELRGVTLTNGYELGGSGGAFFNFGTLELVDSTVSNSFASYHGGGIYNVGGTVTLRRTTVSGNRGNHLGGGICNYNSISTDARGALTVVDSTFSDNQSNQLGGGIYAIGGTTTSVKNSALLRNTSDSGGGMNAAGQVTIENSLIAQNDGMAIRAAGTFTVVDIKNTTISGNTSTWRPGGLRIQYGATVLLENSTITGNSGAALESWVGTTIVFKNTLIEGSCAGYGTSSAGGNIASPGEICVLDDPTDRVGIMPEELKLGPLADNGGATQTHALLPDSIAIDAVPEISCDLEFDQRGVPRPQGTACDVGAFELEQP